MAWDRRTFSRFLARNRRRVSAACAALAILSLGLALRPPDPATIAVAVASRSLPTGHRLQPDDLHDAEVPVAITPGASERASPPRSDELVGRVLAAPVLAGEPVATARLVGPAAEAWAGEPGTSPLPVRFADPGAVDLIDPGQRLDVLTATSSEPGEAVPRAQVVADHVLVLAVVRPTASGGEGPLGASSSTDGDGKGGSDLVVLGATREQALALTAAQAGGRLSFTIATSGPVGTDAASAAPTPGGAP